MKLFLPESRWRNETVPLDEPSGVVGLAEREQRLAKILDRVEGLHPQKVLFQGPDEALGAAIAFGRADEDGRALGTEEFEFLLKDAGPVLRSVIVANGEAASHILEEAAEMLAQALANGFRRFEG